MIDDAFGPKHGDRRHGLAPVPAVPPAPTALIKFLAPRPLTRQPRRMDVLAKHEIAEAEHRILNPFTDKS
jgi:hypothetical protein